MEKTELMKRYEAETGEIATWHWHDKEFVTDDYIAWLESQLRWRPASEKPEHGKTVLATYLNQYGKRRRVRAVYIGQYEEEEDSDDYDRCVEYCEEKDEYYLKEGWYELIDNWDTYSSVAIVEGAVDYWMPFPPAPDTLPDEWEE
jgi:hypothetical protein